LAINNLKEPITIENPKSPVSESYRTLRTNIMFSSLDKKVQTIMVTSSGPKEGKTTVASNLAVIMAQAGCKTVIIDCDLRKPRQHIVFNISNQIGLSNYLIGEALIADVIKQTRVENLQLLPSGIRPPNPAELLGSEKMWSFVELLKNYYDYIILDTSPVVIVTDAQLVSQYADGCLLVVATGEADREAAVKAKELLTKVNSKILGVVLNKVKENSKGRYKHYYYDEQGNKHKEKIKDYNHQNKL
jgi:capsular exopolysaccharide synthesis family protein